MGICWGLVITEWTARSGSRTIAARGDGYEVAHLASLAWDKVMKNDGPWDVATIVDRLPEELGPTLTPRAVPWPERPR